jgi:hypothetical protein
LSNPIRPPGGPQPASIAGVESAADVSAGESSSSVGAGERAGRAAAAGSSDVQGPSEALLARLSAGEVTREQAIEGLVREALEANGAAGLSGARRSELEAILRSALLDDPTLGRLLG